MATRTDIGNYLDPKDESAVLTWGIAEQLSTLRELTGMSRSEAMRRVSWGAVRGFRATARKYETMYGEDGGTRKKIGLNIPLQKYLDLVRLYFDAMPESTARAQRVYGVLRDPELTTRQEATFQVARQFWTLRRQGIISQDDPRGLWADDLYKRGLPAMRQEIDLQRQHSDAAEGTARR